MSISKINKIKVEGKNNIVLQDINNSTITINISNNEELDKFYNDYKDRISEIIDFVNKLEENETLKLFLNEITLRAIPKFLTSISSLDTSYIIGRENDIENIYNQLNSSDKIILINGIGGIGKTTIAKSILNKYKDEFDYVAWIDYSSNIKESFVSNTELILSLSLNNDIKSIEKNVNYIDVCFDLIINKMRRLRKRNLLIIDNANEDIEYLKTIDKITLKPYWKVIITSRNKLSGFFDYELGFLNEIKARELFYLHYKFEQNDLLVNEILKIIDYHTLTIEVIAKTSDTRMYQLSEILEILKKKFQFSQLLSNSRTDHSFNLKIGKYIEYLAKMFDVTSLSDYEKWILKQFAVLPPIYIEYRNNYYKNICNFLKLSPKELTDVFPESLNKLCKLGWIKRENYSYKMHQIIQQTLFILLNPNPNECDKLINTFNDLIHCDIEKDNPIDKFQWLVFSNAILENFDECNFDNIATLFERVSYIDYFTGNYKKAISETESALRIYTNLEDKVGINECLNNLGILYRDFGDLENALKKMELAYEKSLSDFGAEHEQTYIRLGNLGGIYWTLGKYEKAKECILKTIEYEKKILNEDHIRVVISKGDLGLIEVSLGNYDNAIKLLTESFTKYEQRFGVSHPNTNIIRQNLGFAYFHKKNFNKALDLFKISLEYDLKNVGENHPEIAKRYLNISTTYFYMNDLEKAKFYGDKSFQIYYQLYGLNHSQTLVAKQSLDYINSII